MVLPSNDSVAIKNNVNTKQPSSNFFIFSYHFDYDETKFEYFPESNFTFSPNYILWDRLDSQIEH